MPVPAHKHQLCSRAWIVLDRVQKDLGEYFYRETVAFVARRRLMDYVTGRQMVAFVESEREEGCAVDGQAKVARVKVRPIEVRPIEVRIHGG